MEEIAQIGNTQADQIKESEMKSAIMDIAETLSRLEERLEDIGYYSGKAGLAVFYCRYGEFTGDTKYIEKANSILTDILSNINTVHYKGYASFFYRDLAQLGLVIYYLKTHDALTIRCDLLLKKLDGLLYKFMKAKIAEGDLYQVTGALAAGYYFLTRINSSSEIELYLKELVQGIKDNAKEDYHGNFYWRWPCYKSDDIYLGLHCGSAMIINFLSGLSELGLTVDLMYSIITKASNYILLNKKSLKNYHFPIKLNSTADTQSLLLGDLGIGYGLLRGGQVLKSEYLKEAAMTVLYSCCQERRKEEIHIYDASIAYGASGISLLFSRLYKITNEKIFQEAATYWFNKILSFHSSDKAYAGFRAKYNQNHAHTNIAFQEGIIGIGITLMHSLRPDKKSINFLLGYL